MTRDIEFYLNLFEDFLETKNDNEEKILWKLNSINSVMKETSEDYDNLFCENCLRLIMNLFKSFQFDNCDIDSNYFENTSPQQREFVIPLLKSEFI